MTEVRASFVAVRPSDGYILRNPTTRRVSVGYNMTASCENTGGIPQSSFILGTYKLRNSVLQNKSAIFSENQRVGGD